jgi:hypothetical protein
MATLLSQFHNQESVIPDFILLYFNLLSQSFSPEGGFWEGLGPDQRVRLSGTLCVFSILIFMALKNSKTGSLPVSEIYNFMTEHFPYFKVSPSPFTHHPKFK